MRRIAATLAVVVALMFSAAPAWADSDDDAGANKIGSDRKHHPWCFSVGEDLLNFNTLTVYESAA